MKLIVALLLLSLCFSCQQSKTDSKTTIGILPYSNFNRTEIDSVKRVLELTYGFEVIILNPVDLPKQAFTTIRSSRYRADSLLRFESRFIPDSISIIIGLTNKDISTTKYDSKTGEIKSPKNRYVDWGIFGLGQVGGTSCVVSTYRLKAKVSKSKFYTRLKRIATHEVGHVLGLPHCLSLKCVMNDANESIKTIDKSSGKLCEICKVRINSSPSTHQ